MKLYIKQKVFTWGDKFTVKDINGNDRYYVEGEVFSWGKKLHVYDMNGNEAAFIQQKVFSFLPRYFVYVGDEQVADPGESELKIWKLRCRTKNPSETEQLRLGLKSTFF